MNFINKLIESSKKDDVQALVAYVMLILLGFAACVLYCAALVVLGKVSLWLPVIIIVATFVVAARYAVRDR